MAAPDFPRVLFITPAAFNRTAGGSITFGNLFAGWPKERLATVHADPVPVTYETCEKYYDLGAQELRRWAPLERVAPAVPGAATAAPPPSAARRLRRVARKLLFGEQLPDRGYLSAALERWIAQFRPDLIYTCLGTNGYMDLVLAVQERFAIPSVIHFMDDWPAASYRGLLTLPARLRMQRLLRRTLQRASVRLGICEEMCGAYEARYGVPFRPFHNAVEVQRFGAIEKARGDRQVKDVVYVGSIFPVAQDQSLIECCQAVARLAADGVPVRLSIHSPPFYAEPYRDRLLIADNIELHDAITDDAAFFRRIAEADALLVPVNFDARTVRYIRYSMPSKLPAYLFSGTPILAYGPSEVAQMRYLERQDCALRVNSRGVEQVMAGLRTLLADRALGERLGARARQTALEQHDARVVRPRFQQALAGAVESARLSGGPES
jgi:glycosyltransferase involved in cell wall biosynthesis